MSDTATRDAQEARREANITVLGDAYQPSATMTQYRWKQVFEKGVKVWTLKPFTVSLSPSKQLDRLCHRNGVSA